MCFRPSSTQKPIRCPKCGTLNPPNQVNCRECQEELKKPEPKSE